MIRHERLKKKQICFVLPEVVSMEKLDKIILIVEDDDVARSVLQLILRKYFSTVVTAANGEEGLALCHEIKPDLVLADLAMPIVDGFTMINKLTEEHPEQAIVILTAYRDEADMVQGHKVLYKPVDRCELLNAVASTLSIEVMD